MAKRDKKAKKPERERRDPKRRGIMQMLDTEPGPWFYWLLLIAAFGWAIWANNDLRHGQETLSWRETAGTLVKTDVVSKTTTSTSSGNTRTGGGSRSSSSTTWHVEVSYRYQVDGQAYSGDRINWEGGWSYDKQSEARAKARELEKQSTIPVFYDPASPSQACVPGIGFAKLVIGVAMVGTAVGLLIFSILRQRPARKDLPPKLRLRPLVWRALLGGLAATVIGGGLQYLVYLRLFA